MYITCVLEITRSNAAPLTYAFSLCVTEFVLESPLRTMAQNGAFLLGQGARLGLLARSRCMCSGGIVLSASLHTTVSSHDPHGPRLILFGKPVRLFLAQPVNRIIRPRALEKGLCLKDLSITMGLNSSPVGTSFGGISWTSLLRTRLYHTSIHCASRQDGTWPIG
jgi:hypothetical protein